MNARRIPFQFSSTDPLARQKELEKRFGLQPTCQKMYVDVKNPLSMGTTKETSSPRLQHRVPIFAEGYNRPIYSSSVDSMASVPDKKPNVRVIPIEVEGADSRSPRHRNYSGPADMVKDRCHDLAPERISPFKKFHLEDLSKPQSPKFNAEPKVYNIPIKVEGVNDASRIPKVDKAPKIKSVAPSSNGCSQSKSSEKVIKVQLEPNQSQANRPSSSNSCSQSKSSEKVIKVQLEPNQSPADQPKSIVETLLGKIEDVLTEFKTYETGVVEFSGTSKDKQYRYLDEMLTRCMLRLDDIDTMGHEEIRLARKNAVKKIQASIDLLERKASVDSSTEIPTVENNVNEMQDIQEKNDAVASVENETSEVKEMDSSVDDQVITNEGNKSESKVESTDETSLLQTIPQDAVEIEMSEGEADNSLKPANNETELEISEEISSAKVISTNSAQLPDMLSNSESKEKSEALDITNDVDMLDDKFISNVEEESQSKIAQEENTNKSTEVTEIEMVEIEDISSKDLGEKIECETIEKSKDNSDCSLQKTSYAASVLPIDTEMKGVSDALDVGDKCVTDCQ